jgi:histidine triad (HIT) family protein
MEECIFCKIVAGDIPADIIYQDEYILAFRDISPQAPTHLQIIPKKHVPSLVEMEEVDFPITAEMVKAAGYLADKEGISKTGYRLVMNCGEHGGQAVRHLHMHLLGGCQLSNMLG